MRFLSRLLMFIVLLALIGGVVFLATWEMPPPTQRVEKAVPNERFLD